MSDDVWRDPDVKAWMALAAEELVPKIDGSDATISLVPDGEGDIKFAVELGLSIMMDKPILAVVFDGRELPPKLLAVADGVVHLHRREMGTPAGQAKVNAAIEKLFRKLGMDN